MNVRLCVVVLSCVCVFVVFFLMLDGLSSVMIWLIFIVLLSCIWCLMILLVMWNDSGVV